MLPPTSAYLLKCRPRFVVIRDSPLPLNGDFQCKNNESFGNCNICLALLCFVTSVD